MGLLAASPAVVRAQPAGDEIVATRPGIGPGGVVEQAQLFTPDDLLLLEVMQGQRRLTDALPAYSARSGVYLPLGELARLFELAIVVDPNRGLAEGWVASEDRPFTLNLAHRRASIGEQVIELAPEDAAMAQGEIYVRTDVLEKLLPVQLKADVRSLILQLTTKTPLPFETRLEREARRQALGAAGNEKSVAQTFIPTPYQLLSAPAVDFTLSGQHSAEGFTNSYSLRAAGDVGLAGLQLFLSGDAKGLPNETRILLERKDPERRSAIIPGMSRFSLGDTYTPSLALGARSAGGRGISLTSEDYQEIGAFDQIDLRGELTEGWEVELYIDEVLRASQKEAETGQYEFKDVPLVVGLNVIRLVFYGPQGERREEVRRLQVGDAGVRKGEILARFGLVEEGVPVLDLRAQGPPIVEEDPLAEPDLDPPPTVQNRPGLRAAGQVSYGLSASTAVSAGFSHFKGLDDQPLNQVVFGANASVAGFATQANLALDDRGGAGVSLGLAGRLGDVGIMARHAEFTGGFLDEGRSYPGALLPTTRMSALTLDYVLNLGGRKLPLGVRLNREEFENGAVHMLATGRASTSISRFLVSGTVRYETTDSDRGRDSDFSALVTASGLISDEWRVRATAAWDGSPFASLTADRQWRGGNALRLGVAQRGGDSPNTVLQASYIWRLPAFDVSLNGGYATADQEARLGVTFSTGFAFDGRRYRMVGPGAASGGAMSVHAFIDEDGNDRWSKGEAPVPGLRVQGARLASETDKEGRAFIPGLGDGARASVQLDTSTLEDPFLVSPPGKLVIVPRPGRVAVAAFPLHQTGEVEINVAMKRDGEESRPLSALRLQLVDASGAVAVEGRTEYDGTLVLSGVRPGRYAVRVDPAQTASLGLLLDQPLTIEVPASGGFVGQFRAEVRLGVPEERAAAQAPLRPPAIGPPGAASPPLDEIALQSERAGSLERRSPLRHLRALGRGFSRVLGVLNPMRMFR